MSKSEKNFAPKKIKDGIVSVRQSTSGRGSTLRVFVDTSKLLCYATGCSSKYSTLSEDQRKTPWCTHLVEGLQVKNFLVVTLQSYRSFTALNSLVPNLFAHSQGYIFLK